jgi:hypothetical protein
VTLERLLPDAALRPRWSSAGFLVYFGAFVALGGTGALLAILHQDHGEAALVGYSALATAAALGVALVLEQAGRAVAAGVFATLAVVFFAVVVGALESLLDLVDTNVSSGDYEPGTLLVELLTIAAALLALRRFRAPVLLLPVALVLWFAVADLGSIFDWDEAAELLSILVGAALIAAGVAIDRAGLEPFAFWPHAVGGLALGGGAISLISGDAGWLFIGILSLAYVGAAYAFGRSSYAVLGAIGIIATTTYFIQDALSYVGFFVPFDVGVGSAGHDPWQVALYYVAAGLFIVLLGLAGERLVRSGDDDF